jgi:hypothetical protein
MTNDGEPLPPTPEWAKLLRFNEANRRRYARLVAKAWADDQFNRDLEANAADVLRREGFEIPEDAEVAVIRAPLEGGRDSSTVRVTAANPIPPGNTGKAELLDQRPVDRAARGPWRFHQRPV